jgi:hypothetical protein
MLRFVADPAAHVDPDAVEDWPAWASLDVALGNDGIRGKLGRWLVPDDVNDVAELAQAFDAPRMRLLLVPIDDAVVLIRLLGAWLSAPRIAALIRRRDIEAARDAIGDETFEFATRRAGLMGRPGDTLIATVDDAAPMLDDLEPSLLVMRGAVALGLAIGAVPSACTVRLRLRRPASLWKVVADSCRNDVAGDDAWTCIRRLIRDRAPEWSTWLN